MLLVVTISFVTMFSNGITANATTTSIVTSWTGTQGDLFRYHTHTKGDGIPIFIMPVHFSAADLAAGGKLQTASKWAADLILGAEILEDDLTKYLDIYVYLDADTTAPVPQQGYVETFFDKFQKAQDITKEKFGEKKVSQTRMIYLGNCDNAGQVGGHAYGGNGALLSWGNQPQTADEIANNTAPKAWEPNPKYWVLHEFLGHAFAGMADEYKTSSYWSNKKAHVEASNLYVSPSKPLAASVPWQNFIGYEENESSIGIYGYSKHDAWRATEDCFLNGNPNMYVPMYHKWVVYKQILTWAGETTPTLAQFCQFKGITLPGGTMEATDTVDFEISDIVFSGVGKASSFNLNCKSVGPVYAGIKNAALYLTKSGEETPVKIGTASTTFHKGTSFLVKNAIFTDIPVAGDIITIGTGDNASKITLTASNFLTQSAQAPSPTVTYSKGIGADAVFTIKADKNAVITVKDSAGKSASFTMVNTSVSKKLSEIFTGNDSNAAVSALAGDGLLYFSCNGAPLYSSASPELPVYYSTSAQAASPAISYNAATGEVTVKLKGAITNVNFYKEGSGTPLTITKSGTNSVSIPLSDLSTLFTTDYTKIRVTAVADNKLSTLSTALTIPKTNANVQPLNVLNESSPVVLKNNFGTADQIIIGALPAGYKIMVFADTGSGLSSAVTDKTLSPLDDKKKVINDYAPYYTGLTATTKAGKDTTIKTNLAPYVGYKLYFCIVKSDGSECTWILNDNTLKDYTVINETVSSTWTSAPTIKTYYFYGDTTSTIMVTGAKIGDTVTLYNSTTNKLKSVVVKENTFVAFTGIKDTLGYDQILISRPGMQTLSRQTLTKTLGATVTFTITGTE